MDATALYDVVDQLDQCSAALRNRVDVLDLTVRNTHWYSPASRVAIARVTSAGVGLIAAAGELDSIVASVRALADAVAARP